MANRYWVGGSGNWNSTSHWSDTSGGASGASVPTSADDVFVDANSGSGYININTTCNCLSIDFTGSSIATVQGSYTLNVYGSFTGAAGITWSHSGSLYFQATSTGQTITSAGITFSCNVYLQGAGGGWTLQDEFSQVSGKWFYANYGTFNTNNQTCTFGYFSYSNTNIKDLTFGSSTITVQGSLYGNATNTTIDMGTATWHFANGSGSFSQPNTHHLYNVVSDASCTRLSWGSGQTIDNNFTIEAPTEYVKQVGAWSITITGNLIINGTENNRVAFDGVFGTMTVTVGGTVSLSHCDFNNFTASGGGGTPWTGTRLGKWYNVNNITTDTPRTLYWVGDGGNYSSTSHWSTSSGGSSGSNPPLPQDTVIFDANSISSGSQTITCDRYIMGKNFNASAVTDTPTFAFTDADTVGGVGSDITGYNFTDSVNLGPINVTIPAADTSMVITNDTNPTTCEFYPHTGTGNLPEIYLNEEGGVLTVNLNGELNASGLTMGPVTFNSNSYDINIIAQSGATSYFGCSNSGGALNLGTSVINLNYDNGSSSNGMSTSGNWTGDYTIYLNAPSNTNYLNIYQSSSTPQFPNVRVDGRLSFSGSYNYTIGTLTLEAGSYFKFKNGYTLYITEIVSNATAISEANLISSSAGSQFNISKASGVVRTYETAIKDSNATGGADFRAVASTSVSNNAGWVFVEELVKTASSKANMHSTVDVTAQSKAAIAVSGVTKTASSKAEIVIDRPIKTASSKANILPQKEAQNKARIKTTGTEKTASSKALIDAHKRYWVGDSGVWHDTAHWAYYSGGAGGAPVPTQYDDAIFDANSFSTTGQTVTISTTAGYCKDIDWSAVTNNPTWDFSSYRDIYIYGNMYLNANMTCTTSGGSAPGIFFYGTGDFVINTYGCVTPDYEFLFYQDGCNITLQSDVDCRTGIAYSGNGGFYIDDGNLDLNGYDVYTGTFDDYTWGTAGHYLYLGEGNIYIDYEYGYFEIWADHSNSTVLTETCTVHFTKTSYINWDQASFYYNPDLPNKLYKVVIAENGYLNVNDGGFCQTLQFDGSGCIEFDDDGAAYTVNAIVNNAAAKDRPLLRASNKNFPVQLTTTSNITISNLVIAGVGFTGAGSITCDETCIDGGANAGMIFTRNKGPKWDIAFDGDSVPPLYKYWYYQGGAGDPTVNESTGGAWHIVCPEGRYRVYGDIHWAVQGWEDVLNAIGHTAEVRFKSVTDNNTDYALTILSQNDDVTYQDVYVKNGQIIATDGLDTNTIVDVDPTEYHIYRGTVIGNTKKLYIDGVLKSTLTGAATGGGAGIYFGPWSSAAGNANANEGYWDYVYYRVDGAYDIYNGAESKARIKSSGVTVTAQSKAYISRIGVTYTAQNKARVWQLGTTKTADNKARIKTTGNVVTASAKARIKVLDNDKTADSKALILKVWDKTAQALARIKQLANTVTATTKARIKTLGTTATAGSKARIKVVDNDKSATAKARIKQIDNNATASSQARIKATGTTKTVTARARIKRLAQQVTASSKALIKFLRTKTASAKARILQTYSKTASTKARIKSLGYVKTASSKARIKSTGATKSASSRARIHQTYNKTAQSKARVVYRRTKTATSKALITDKRRWYVERPQAWQTKPAQAWYTPSEPTWNNETPADWYDPAAQDWQDES